MEQPMLFDDFATAQADPRVMGDMGALRATLRATAADPLFSIRARDFVLTYLRRHGQAPGEDITDAAKSAGITPPDDRAFGSVYSTLARSKQICFAGYCARRKGHGTAGGRLWKLGAP